MKSKLAPHRRSRLAMAAAACLSMLMFAAAPAAQAVDENPTLSVAYDAVGSTHVGAQVDADMPLGPTEIKVKLDAITAQIVDGTMNVPSKVMNFDIFGIPSRATVTMTQVGPVTGSLTPIPGERGKNVLVSNVKYDIKLSNVQARVFGIWWPLAVGSNCHTINPAAITATTPQGEFFTVNGGGRVAGTYTIGNFTGCTPLNFFDIPGFFPWFGSVPINALVPGSNNTLDLSLANPRYGG